MEILEQLNSIPEGIHVGIIPTVLLPFALLSTGISIIATFIAGLFGIKLKAEGPKKLLEILLKPKLLISALVLNAAIYGLMQVHSYVKNGPVPEIYQNIKNRNTQYTQKAIHSDSTLYWQQHIKQDGFFSDAIVIGNELFAGSKNGILYAFNADTGELTHKVYIGKFIAPKLVQFKGFIYFGEGLHQSHHMHIYKFDPSTKEIVGRFKTKGHTEARIMAKTIEGEDYIFFAAGNDGLYAINPRTMTKRWHYINGHMDSNPIIFGDSLYIGTGVPKEDLGKYRPLAIKLDLKTGSEKWVKEIPLSSWFGPIVVEKSVCFPLGEIHVTSNLGGYQCFLFSGERSYSLFVDQPVMGKQISIEKNILFNDFKGTLYKWDYQAGKVVWRIDNKSAKYSFSSSQKIRNDDYLFFNREGRGIIYNIQTGSILNTVQFNKEESVIADPISYENGVIVLGLDGTIKNYKIESLRK